jgi:hypothetical protein
MWTKFEIKNKILRDEIEKNKSKKDSEQNNSNQKNKD